MPGHFVSNSQNIEKGPYASELRQIDPIKSNSWDMCPDWHVLASINCEKEGQEEIDH